jgi:Ca-activated chloride channel family protein
MSDPDLDLNRLSKRRVPEPRAEAAFSARRAAMDAFEASQKTSAAPQGTATPSRLSRIATLMWSSFMNTRLLTGTALATLMIAPIAGIATWQIMQTRDNAPMIVSEPLAKKDIGGALVDDDKNAPLQTLATEQVEPAKPAAPAQINEGLADPEFAAKAKTESDAMMQAEGELAPMPAPVGNAQPMAEFKAGGAPADGVMRRKLEQEPQASADSALTIAQPESMIAPAPMPDAMVLDEENRDKFPQEKSNSVVAVATQPVSTFSVDVDTSGYSAVRRMLNFGALPEPDAVRVEEMVNYFPYAYPGPEKAEEAFKANVTVTPSPWNQNTKLLHIGIKGYDLPVAEQKPANLVFLLDVSGSMDEPDKLPLLKSSFRLLVNKLKPTDTVSIVTYAGNAGIVLEPTKVSESAKILNAIDTLQPGGSTAGEAGINAAYALAQQAFVKDGVNRIMLATDGDFNVGAASEEDLKKLVEDKRKSGVFLSVLGFGQGNYQDNLMQTLAQNGNGIAAYIDTLSEAEKVLVQEATASLFTIAKDVKIQVEFNPARVSEYRLIGYETRALANEDFNNDRVDAGDIGSGHTVTAIYEMTPKGAPGQLNDPLRYQTNNEPDTFTTSTGEYAFVKMRYKLPNENTSRLVTQPVTDQNAVTDIAQAPEDVRFGIAVSAFGQKLRDEDATANYPVAEIETLADSAKGTDAFGYRAEFLKLVRLAKGLMGG